MLNFLRIWKSIIDDDEVKFVLLPVKVTLEETKLIADFHCINLLLNLAWFLTNQIVARVLTIVTFITILHRGIHLLSHGLQISSTLLKCKFRLIVAESQVHILIANEQSKKRLRVVSSCLKQRLQIEGRLQPFSLNFSSVSILSCIILQAIKDLEGGISLLHIVLAQWIFWVCRLLNK